MRRQYSAWSGFLPMVGFCELIPCKKVLQHLIGPQLVKKFPAAYRTPRFNYRIHNPPQSVPILRQISQVHCPFHFFNIYFSLSSHRQLGLPNILFPSGFPSNTLYVILISLVQATCSAHLILLDLISRRIFGEKYES